MTETIGERQGRQGKRGDDMKNETQAGIKPAVKTQLFYA